MTHAKVLVDNGDASVLPWWREKTQDLRYPRGKWQVVSHLHAIERVRSKLRNSNFLLIEISFNVFSKGHTFL